MKSLTNSLKQANVGWITAMILLDMVILLIIIAPDVLESATITKLAMMRISVAGFLPILVLFVSSLLSSGMKDVLVFWRIRDVLPGHRAFSVHGPADPRIDVAKLKRNTGAFPDEPREQNVRWYALYKQVASETAVDESQRLFLGFRDLSAISLLLTLAVPSILFVLDSGVKAAGASTLLLLVQYLLSILAARHNAVRFVTNVLAVHSTTKVGKASTPRTRAAGAPAVKEGT